jgi:hypothetical protein
MIVPTFLSPANSHRDRTTITHASTSIGKITLARRRAMATVADAVALAIESGMPASASSGRGGGRSLSQPLVAPIARLVEWPVGVTVVGRVLGEGAVPLREAHVRLPPGSRNRHADPAPLWFATVGDSTGVVTVVCQTPGECPPCSHGWRPI